MSQRGHGRSGGVCGPFFHVPLVGPGPIRRLEKFQRLNESQRLRYGLPQILVGTQREERSVSCPAIGAGHDKVASVVGAMLLDSGKRSRRKSRRCSAFRIEGAQGGPAS